jgi:predicted metal-dependent hydrolase
MSQSSPEYDPRYLAGVVLFNQHEFFDAHEVWESLWLSADVGEDRRFIQGLIQAAVGLYHFGTGNSRGARKLYHTARAYMEAYPSPYLGLDHALFWSEMHRCFEELLNSDESMGGVELDGSRIPTIALEPAPNAWPNPDDYLHDED